jgi:hypothetical protein
MNRILTIVEQVETLLKSQEPAPKLPDIAKTSFTINNSNPNILQQVNTDFNVSNPHILLTTEQDVDRWGFNPGESPNPPMDDMNFDTSLNMGMPMEDATFTWEMIGLGLEEPLPPQETIDEL